ncbi:MAG: VWA domain-containing protein [Oscillospiraceae bacterium]|nr:VWA domain-containing protein [Oscillospiraceae bacterium]
MSSNKKRKNNQSKAKSTNQNNTSVSKQQIKDSEPVQSLSDLVALAHEAEADMAEKESAAQNTNSHKDNQENAEKTGDTAKSDQPKSAEKGIAAKNDQPKSAEKGTAAKNDQPKTTTVKQHTLNYYDEEYSGSMDALDRDLALAKRRKEREDAQNMKLRRENAQKEAEAAQRAEESAKKAAIAAENARIAEEHKAELRAIEKLEKLKAEEAEKAANAGGKKPTKTPAKKKKVKISAVDAGMRSMAAMRAAAVVFIVIVIAYVGIFIYTTGANSDYYDELDLKLTGQSKSVNDSSREYTLSSSYSMTAEEKEEAGLAIGLADSDSDGLSDYYEINVSKTDPLNPDSDGNGLLDGAEVMNGLDPLAEMTGGSTPDTGVYSSVSLSASTVTVSAENAPKTAVITLTDSDNNSIQGTSGLIGTACELYMDYSGTVTLTFAYTEEELNHWKTQASALSVYRFNSDTLSFDQVDSTLASDNTVTAEVNEGGIYLLADSGIITEESTTRVFFLIDNSGSMYPEELCENSEENDVEFKRLDFSIGLIDKLNENAEYGAAKFSGNYTLISHISDDSESVKESIDAIRYKSQYFSGTEIAGAISSAVEEFDDSDVNDKNYIILLTDGMPTTYNSAADDAAIEAANEKDITIFTIGLGKYIDADYLLDIANRTNGQFFQATNADALENIYEKIQSSMSYNRVIVTSDESDSDNDSGTAISVGYLIADSGFDVSKDGLTYTNFRTDFALTGADFGIAGLNMAYYSGTLELAEDSYITMDGTVVAGYDVSGIESIADGKAYLSDLTLDILDVYQQYLNLPSKWDYTDVDDDGVLPYTSAARTYIDNHNMGVLTTDYTGTFPAESDFLRFCRKITFKTVKQFSSYENVYIDSTRCEGNDLEVINMIRYFCYLPDSAQHSTVCDFGYDGDVALDALVDELTSGRPAVISVNGSAMNAVRLIRDASNPNNYVLEAYDSNSPGRVTKITLVRSPIYTPGSTPTYQYAAYLGGQNVTLQLYIY